MTYSEMVLAVLEGDPYELESRHPERETRYTCDESGHLVYRCGGDWRAMEADRPGDEVDGWQVHIRHPETFWSRGAALDAGGASR